ncbi:MAG: glycosyltransferase [Pseudomonadota bacterium]|jgi:alpha-1,6-mannosyltransferase
MRYCDLTLAYTPTSGGIRTYIDAKRQYLKDEGGDDEHVLLIPGESDHLQVDGRFLTCTVASPVIPGCAPYRFFWRPDKLVSILEETRPDIVELGSFFVSPWAAFRYRAMQAAAGRKCLVSAYFHTDIADAYFGRTLRKALDQLIKADSPVVAEWEDSFVHFMEDGAARYFGHVFQQCDVLFAASPAQRDRLRKYGVGDAEVVPLGVDLELFHPGRRSAELRASLFGADAGTVVIVYAGRLDAEKHVDVLIEAFRRCRLPDARLILTGEGPLREKFETEAANWEHLRVIPYQKDRTAFAALLASADIYATAGPHETFGLSVVEAQACGLPVVGVNAGALPERVVPGTGFLGPAENAEALARNLELAARQRESLSRGARRHVEQAGYGWNSVFERLFRIYRTRWSQLS